MYQSETSVYRLLWLQESPLQQWEDVNPCSGKMWMDLEDQSSVRESMVTLFGDKIRS